jgi:ankyrin repeat protein
MNHDVATIRMLLDNGVDPDQPGQFETPAIHWLVRYNDVDTVRLLLDKGSDPNISSRYGVTPLTLAIAAGNTDMVEVLLQAGADPNTNEYSGEPVLLSAAAVGVPGSVMALVKHGAVVDARDPAFGQTALMFAAREGHAAIVDYLLRQGADPNAETLVLGEERWVPPNSQRGFGWGIGIIRGGTPADRGRRDPIPGKLTPLLYAARGDHTEAASLLLDAGADINQADANGIYPLLMAISNNKMETAHLLIERGSQINVSDWYGRSPLWEAVNVRNLYLDSETFTNYVDRGPVLELIKVLLEKGADVNARTAETPPFRNHFLGVGSLEWVDFTGQTPFLSAALSGDVTVMKLLLDNGADPHIHTYQGTSPLMAAAGVNWVVSQTYTESPEQLLEAVRICYELGMDINQTNSMGLTALHGAANRGSNDIIQFLVEHGAKLDALDNEGRSPLTWAKGVFLATHPAEEKPESMALISRLQEEKGMPVR